MTSKSGKPPRQKKRANPKRKLPTRDLFETNPMEWWQRHADDIKALAEGESLRGVAVLARGYLESILDEFLLWHALKDSEHRRDLAKAVAHGLVQKIEICEKLELISEHPLEYMNLIRLIGDRFAHHPELRDFDDDEILLDHITALYAKHAVAVPVKATAYLARGLLVSALLSAIGHMGDWEYRHLPSSKGG